MIRHTLLASLLLITFSSYSQKQTNTWYFGTLAGVNFNSGAPSVLTNGNTTTNEGTASISDSAGNLLFYTDGTQVWNRNNVLMLNGIGLLGDVSTTQTLIVPNPGNASLFYIFTIDDEGGPDGLNYSVVDMSLQGGNGDVTVKNSFLRSNMTEKVAAVLHCNNNDIWVMTHEWHTDAFVAWPVTNSGIGSPVITHAGMVNNDVHGQMKFASDGNKLASAVGYQDTVEVLDFDKSTGTVSNPLSISISHHVYGLEFSPSNLRLYGTYYDIGGNSSLYQLDLTAANIPSSLTVLSTESSPILYGIQLASDNKIYVTLEITPFLGVINLPDVLGTGCNYVPNAVNLDPSGMGTMCMLGLPGFMQSYFHPQFPNIPCSALRAAFTADTAACTGDCLSFTDSSSGAGIVSYSWTFTGGSPATSSVANPAPVCYSVPGNYAVQLVVSDGIISDTAIHQIIVHPTPAVNAGANATIAPGDSITLGGSGSATAWSWSPGGSLSDSTILQPIATPSTTTTYVLTGTDANGCLAQDAITVTVELPCGEVFVPTAFSPNHDGENDFECVMGDCITSMQFAIYNRWGEKVFESADRGSCWDGVYKGSVLNSATFVYYLKATLRSGEEITRKGSINLIR